MYGIFTDIWAIYGVNVGKYSIHGAYGIYIYSHSTMISGLYLDYAVQAFYDGLTLLISAIMVAELGGMDSSTLAALPWATGGSHGLLKSVETMEKVWEHVGNIWEN